MDLDRNRQLDQILERTSASALKSLSTVIDVRQNLRDLHREVELLLDPPQHRPSAPASDS